MAAEQATDEALEAYLQTLTRALDLQASLARSALDLHPAFSLVDFRKAAEEATSKFNVAIGDLRSDLIAAAATPAGSGEPPATTAAEQRRLSEPPATTATLHLPKRAFRSSLITAASIASRSPAASPKRASMRSRGSRGSSARQARRLMRSLPSGEKLCHLVERGSTGSPASGPAMSDDVTKTSTIDTQYMKKVTSRDIDVSPCIDGVLNPGWPPRLAWDLLVIFLALCDSVVIPYQLAEFRTDPGLDDFYLWFTVCLFTCDLLMNFFTGYHAGKKDEHQQEGALVTDRASIAVHYLRGWFWVDFLSTVPWHVIADAFKLVVQTDASSEGQVTKIARVVKLTRLLRLMRLLRLWKLAVIWDPLEGRIGSITVLNVVSMLKVLGIWTAICHWGACFWWMVGKRDSLVMLLTFQDGYPEGLHWTELPRRHSAHDDFGQWTWVERPASEQYVFCFYWILGVMRTMPAEVTPVNLVERLFVLLFMFFAVIAFAVNVARITQAWFKFSARKDLFKEEMVYVRMHLKAINCGTSLQERTQAYLNHIFEKRKLHARELGLLSVLPEGLKRKLNEAHRIRYLRMIPRLQDWIDPFLRRVCDATEVLDYLPGDKVTEENDDAEAAYVLMRGRLQVYVPYSVDFSETIGARSPMTVVDENCLFEHGERAPTSQYTVVALECSELLRVDRLRFHEVLQVRRSHAQLRLAVHGDDPARAANTRTAPEQAQPLRTGLGDDSARSYGFADQSPARGPHDTMRFFWDEVDRESFEEDPIGSFVLGALAGSAALGSEVSSSAKYSDETGRHGMERAVCQAATGTEEWEHVAASQVQALG
jgi:hypothetical protein